MRIVLLNTYFLRGVIVLIFLLFLKNVYCQSGEETVARLVQLGFENVRWTEDDEERVYVIEDNTYSQTNFGLGEAIDQIQQTGLPDDGKACSLIVLKQNIPFIACYLERSSRDVTRRDWQIRYDLGDSWDKVKRIKAQNRSLNKVDVVLHPEFFWRNIYLTVPYQVLLNLAPAIEISLWQGMKASFQVLFPIVNDYGEAYAGIRPGFFTLSQQFRLPHRTFVTATVGTFGHSFRYGGDLSVYHYLCDPRFSVDAQFGYTAQGRYRSFAYYFEKDWQWTGHIRANFYWPKYNTQLSARVQRFLLGEYGIRCDMMRHFKYASVGFYAQKIKDPKLPGIDAIHNDGFDGGFCIQIAIPPYKVKRKGYWPRIKGGLYRIDYSGGSDRNYGRYYRAGIDDNYRKEINYNPYFIKSELLNY